jgi:integrase
LRLVFNYAKWERWIAQNPLPKRAEIIPADLAAQARHLVTVAEEERLLAACVGDLAYFRPAITYIADTGALSGDCRKLTWSDVDFERRIVHVRKGGVAKMTPRLYETLRTLRAQSDGAADFVFALPRYKSEFSKLRASAGLGHFKLGDLRRSAAWRMAQAGMSIEQIAKQIGAIALDALRRYLEVDPQVAQAEINSPAFQAFIKEQFGRVGNGNEQANGGDKHQTERDEFDQIVGKLLGCVDVKKLNCSP